LKHLHHLAQPCPICGKAKGGPGHAACAKALQALHAGGRTKRGAPRADFRFLTTIK